MVERVHPRIMMRGGGRGRTNTFSGESSCREDERRGRGGGQVCVVERVHARIMMRGGGRGGEQMCVVENKCVWWRECMGE